MGSIDQINNEFGQQGEIVSPERAKALVRLAIDKISEKAVAIVKSKLNLNPESGNARHEFCRALNSEVLVLLMNELRIPGMILTQFVDKTSATAFKKPWNFHAIGILHLQGDPASDDALYATFDETNKTDGEKYFLRVGTLTTLSNELTDTFGGDWKLDFIPPNEPESSIPAKIRLAEDILQSGETVSYEKDILYDPSGPETKKVHKPLGLRYVSTSSLVSPKMRQFFTYGYA